MKRILTSVAVCSVMPVSALIMLVAASPESGLLAHPSSLLRSMMAEIVPLGFQLLLALSGSFAIFGSLVMGVRGSRLALGRASAGSGRSVLCAAITTAVLLGMMFSALDRGWGEFLVISLIIDAFVLIFSKRRARGLAGWFEHEMDLADFLMFAFLITVISGVFISPEWPHGA